MIKGVLFDKDGTIMDFHSLWVPVTRTALAQLIGEKPVRPRRYLYRLLLRAAGLEHGIRADSVAAYGTYQDMLDAVCPILRRYGIDSGWAAVELERCFERLIKSGRYQMKPIGPVGEILRELGRKNIAVGLATSDNLASTQKCLKELSLENAFSFIGTSDGPGQAKPHPDLLHAFCRQNHLDPHQVAVVGDTPNDMIFAKNGGAIAVGVLSGVGDREDLRPLADHIFATVSDCMTLFGI